MLRSRSRRWDNGSSKFDCGLIKAQLSGHLWRRYERAFPRMLFVERARLLLPLQMRANDHLRFDNIFARSSIAFQQLW
jgi:hypothetical protein